MAFEFHRNASEYFRHQYEHARQFIVPFIQEIKPVKDLQVLEIGCGEGGVLKAFLAEGCICTGVDLSVEKIKAGSEWLQNELNSGQLKFISEDIYKVDTAKLFTNKFDIIILKDTIEHIFNQPKIIEHLKLFLKPGGIIYYGFPAWCMPFGGHQQICHHPLLSKLPWIHLLPRPLYKIFLKIWGEPEACIKELLEIQETGISTWRFEKVHQKIGYEILERRLYFINPIYTWKFGLKPRVLPSILSWIPGLRDFFTTAAWYIVKPIN
ncbi:MAG: class I SAM-dependent methyltransferase [Sphingobacteriia bacterium]|nr:class I SAM-dependent methyltransferase [Sphingobacteriia bacterium]